MSFQGSERLRPHPDERFKPPQHLIDLDGAAEELAAEPTAPNRHRQKTLYRHGALTVALFLFDAGAGLAEHRADGVVTIQVLRGRIHVTAEGEEHDLAAGRLLVLSPGVRHDLRAEESTRLLLTITKEPDAVGPAKVAK